MLKRLPLAVLPLGVALLAQPAFASFHQMQIEQVMGGVNGDATRQAIQLRMRFAGENLLQPARIRAWDAAGANPIIVFDFTAVVTNGAAGSRVLVATANFLPGLVPDFVITTPIPASYLAAGKLTYETDDGLTVLWSLAWGGANYTGTNTGSTFNDADGLFNPPFAGPLPSSDTKAVRFPGAAGALSSTNAADYAITSGAALFTNNAGMNGTVPVELLKFDIE